MSRFMQGSYTVINPKKYVGDVKKVRYLSSWELHLFKFLDLNPHILFWGSESTIVPYYSPADGRNRRYMVDIFVKYKNKNGDIIKELLEVKPHAQTLPPKNTARKKKTTYLKELYTYNVNIAKWKAASEYARKRKMEFRIITEKHLFKS